MKSKLPITIALKSNDKRSLLGIKPVTSLDLKDVEGNFHPEGIYSEEIFGNVTGKERYTSMGFIPLNLSIMHPKLLIELHNLNGLYKGIMDGSRFATWDDDNKEFVKSDPLDGETGYYFFMKKFLEIKYKKNTSGLRDVRIALLEKFKDKAMYRHWLVIPAGLREINMADPDRPVEDDIARLYRKLIRVSNSVDAGNDLKDGAHLDTIRSISQQSVTDIYSYLHDLIDGKGGFALGKVASRNVYGGSRNVITAMDTTSSKIGAGDAVHLNETMIGLHQFIKATLELSIYHLKKNGLSHIFDILPANIQVVDKKTWKAKMYYPTSKITQQFGSNDGLTKVVEAFGEVRFRHSAVEIGDSYLGLIYRDKTSFKIFRDIEELPDHLSRDNVTPLTWAELMYTSVLDVTKVTAGNMTRYPIADLGSIYDTYWHLATTTSYETLKELNWDWEIDDKSKEFPRFPMRGAAFFDSLSPHPSRIDEMDADYDGDKTTSTVSYIKESVDRVRKIYAGKSVYRKLDGSLRYGVINKVTKLVLHNLTKGRK